VYVKKKALLDRFDATTILQGQLASVASLPVGPLGLQASFPEGFIMTILRDRGARPNPLGLLQVVYNAIITANPVDANSPAMALRRNPERECV
jgi:hypothetical protein